MLKDGRLYVEDNATMKIFGKQFCLENFKVGPATVVVSAFVCSSAEPELTFKTPDRAKNKKCFGEFNHTLFLRNIRFIYTILGSLSQGANVIKLFTTVSYKFFK